jgi:hypothetical protein
VTHSRDLNRALLKAARPALCFQRSIGQLLKGSPNKWSTSHGRFSETSNNWSIRLRSDSENSPLTVVMILDCRGVDDAFGELELYTHAGEESAICHADRLTSTKERR